MPSAATPSPPQRARCRDRTAVMASVDVTAPRRATAAAGLRGPAQWDFPLLGVALTLAALGLIAVYSASITVADQRIGDSEYYLQRQSMYLALGVLGGYLVSQARVALWHHLAGFAVLAATALLVLAAVIAALAGGYHVLGTDKVGQDVLYLSLKSIRTGVIIGGASLLVALPLALLLGTAAGFFGGRVDDLVQYLYATLNAIPGVLLIAAAVLTLDVYMDQHLSAFAGVQQRADLRLTALCLILGATGWIGLCRLLRGESLKLRELEYVQSARALGQPQWRIITRHVWPNLMHLVLLTAVIDFSGLVLAEAVLSYVGVGVDPGTVSWGNMINTARLELAREPVVWWSLAAAFVFMLGLVLPANLLADALRDALDPRQSDLRP
ncbi:MAG TPA: peptide ABC transporter permease [Gammaproteobacteria bacterium]|nr:peptide ABC transporter permease [Gammaproteobacteria bacterium]MCH78702.1 peptide ABC transporter permease [Gammaproteobacteria bacterium]